jgi:Cu/Ag efflux protein CusF
MNWKAISSGMAAAGLVSTIVMAQSATRNITAPITETVTIQAIDQTDRLITIRNSKGEETTVYATPEVKRFSELKVGQKVQVRYYESVVYSLAPSGAKSAPLSETAAATAGKGTLPGGTVARQMKATVEVVSVDPAVPSITIKTASGSTITRKVEDAKRLAGVKPGDHIDITYTEAALVQVQ